jgi:hypothetical protein
MQTFTFGGSAERRSELKPIDVLLYLVRTDRDTPELARASTAPRIQTASKPISCPARQVRRDRMSRDGRLR